MTLILLNTSAYPHTYSYQCLYASCRVLQDVLVEFDRVGFKQADYGATSEGEIS
jgi:hypothetical protein